MRRDCVNTNKARGGFVHGCARIFHGDSVISGYMFVALVIFLLSMGTLIAYDVHVRNTTSRQSGLQNLRSVGSVLAETTQALLEAGEISAVRRIVMETGRRHALESCRVTLPSGAVVADATPSRIDMLELPESWPGKPKEQSEQWTEDSVILSYGLDVPGRGEASLELIANVETLSRGHAEPVAAKAAIAGAALVGVFLVYHHARRRLKGITAIRETLIETGKEQVETSVLQVDPELGQEAIAWNRLLFEREHEDARAAMEQISDAMQTESKDRVTAAGICDGLPYGLIIVGEDMQIEYANGAAAVLLQTRRSELEGCEMVQFISDDHLGDRTRSILSGTAARCVAVELTRDGATGSGVLRFTVCPAHQNDKRLAVIVVEDVSQQKVAAEARNSFLAHATHELRTPLTNIQLYVESALETCETNPAATAGHLDVINSECKRLGRTVSEILSVSQIEAGSLSLSRDDVRMDDLLKSVQADYEPYAADKQIVLRFDLPPKLPVLQADRDQVSLAIHNILGNAIKYTPQGGEVSVEVRVDDERIEIEIRDTGIGIDTEDLTRVFEKFYRARDKRIDGVVGSGLGLSIAREVVRLHGGDITVDSELDKGSTFTLVLPVSEELIHNGDTSTAMRCG